MTYVPPQEILDKYADLLVNFALNGEKGIKKGDIVLLQISECARPMLKPAHDAIVKAGGHPIIHFMPDGLLRSFIQLASPEQLKFSPDILLKARIDQIDHLLQIIGEDDLNELKGIDPKKIMLKQGSMANYMRWRHEKEAKGKLTWTLCMYGTPSMAKEASMTIEEYWEQIIKACYLDHPDPKKKWKEIMSEIHRVRDRLNKLKIEKIRVTAPGTDITIGLGKNRQWMAGTGRNIPTYEIFISPHREKTEGHITFTEPLYRHGSIIKGIYLEFRKGKIVKATAKEGEEILKAMISQKNANMIGEYSLTDGRLSRITRFMAETLFDENRGGRYGNTHLAIGEAYKDSYPGNPGKVPKAKWAKMGYNESPEHTDIISTSDRTVTATLPNGKEMVIYRDGKFTV